MPGVTDRDLQAEPRQSASLFRRLADAPRQRLASKTYRRADAVELAVRPTHPEALTDHGWQSTAYEFSPRHRSEHRPMSATVAATSARRCLSMTTPRSMDRCR